MKGQKTFYSKKELLLVLKNKYHFNWRSFCRQKEGKWLYRNNDNLFKEFQSKFSGKNFDFRESSYQKELVQKLKVFFNENKIKVEIQEEVFIGRHKNINNRIDLIINLPKLNISIPVEVKHDNSHWIKKSLKEQLKRYNSCLKKQGFTEKVYLLSPNGKYGFSEKEFFSMLITKINHCG